MEPTSEQSQVVSAFFDSVPSGANLRVQALAGTGKTTMLREISRSAEGYRGLYLTFNREAARTAALAPSCPVFNWHRLAAKQIYEAFGSRTADLLATDVVPETALSERLPSVSVLGIRLPPDWVAVQVLRAVDRCRLSDALSVRPAHVLVTDDDVMPESANELRTQVAEAANFALDHDLVPHSHGDYLKTWATMSDPLFGYDLDYVLVDEAQDLPDLLGSMLGRLPCTVLLVGDRYQYLNGYAGATLSTLSDPAFGDTLPLTKSFRFGEDIAEIGNSVLETLGSPYFLEGVGNHEPTAETVHLTRTNRESFQLAEAMSEHSPQVIGSERLQRQRAELLRLRDDRSLTSEMFGGLTYDQLTASTNLFSELSVLTPTLDLPEFDSLSTDSPLKISTVHKFKGLEASNVVVHSTVLDDPESLESLMLKYVAVTRAKTNLEIL